MFGYWGEDNSIGPVSYHCGTVIVSSLVYFFVHFFFVTPSHPYLPVSLEEYPTQEYFKSKREWKQKFVKPQQEQARHEEQMK